MRTRRYMVSLMASTALVFAAPAAPAQAPAPAAPQDAQPVETGAEPPPAASAGHPDRPHPPRGPRAKPAPAPHPAPQAEDAPPPAPEPTSGPEATLAPEPEAPPVAEAPPPSAPDDESGRSPADPLPAPNSGAPAAPAPKSGEPSTDNQTPPPSSCFLTSAGLICPGNPDCVVTSGGITCAPNCILTSVGLTCPREQPLPNPRGGVLAEPPVTHREPSGPREQKPTVEVETEHRTSPAIIPTGETSTEPTLPALPFTGLPLLSSLAIALALVASGLMVRRRLPRARASVEAGSEIPPVAGLPGPPPSDSSKPSRAAVFVRFVAIVALGMLVLRGTER